ncbi:MAG: hypothetical protein ACR2FY_07605 [Pirellulaceae bacterium]
MPAEPLFSLLQTRHERIEPTVLQEALLDGAGLPKADAARAAHRCRGILAERLTHKQGDGARGSLARRQIETILVPAEQMMKLTPPVSVQWLQVGEAGLIVPADYYGRTETVRWPNVFVISSGLVAKSIEERKPHDVEEMHGRRRVIVTEYKAERKTEQQHITEVLGLSADGKLLHFRLHAHRLHKQQLTQGGPTASVFEKYLLLLDDLVVRCQWAEVSPETRLILADRKDRPPEVSGRRPYDFDEGSFDLYNRWLLQLVMLREKGLIAAS